MITFDYIEDYFCRVWEEKNVFFTKKTQSTKITTTKNDHKERPQRTTTTNGMRFRRERHFLLLSFKDAMQTEGAEYGAGRMPALPAFTNSEVLRKGCAGWGV
jgi:hypothetical protein